MSSVAQAFRPAEEPVKELLDRLVDQMVAGGIHFEDGRREFERRFISRVLSETGGHLSRTAEQLGRPPEHPDQETGRIGPETHQAEP